MVAMRTRYSAGISRNTVLLAFASLFADISSEILVAGLLWDHGSHAAVFYYGGIFAIADGVGLFSIPAKRNRLPVDA